MANEILYSGLADLRVAEVLKTKFQLMLADRNALPQHPVLLGGYLGDIAGAGSTTCKLAQLGFFGFDDLAAVAENTAAAEIALTDASVTVTIQRYAKQYNASGLASLTDSVGFPSKEDAFVQDTLISCSNNLTNLVADVIDGFTATEGPGTGVDLDLASLIRGAILLQVANAPVGMGVLGILANQQWGDIHLELLGSTAGAVQWAPATQEQIVVSGQGLKGKFFGIDIFTSNRVNTVNAGADLGGALLTQGAVVWADASPMPDGDANKLILGRGCMYARDYNNGTDVKQHVMNHYAGASLGIDAAGVTIISDA